MSKQGSELTGCRLRIYSIRQAHLSFTIILLIIKLDLVIHGWTEVCEAQLFHLQLHLPCPQNAASSVQKLPRTLLDAVLEATVEEGHCQKWLTLSLRHIDLAPAEIPRVQLTVLIDLKACGFVRVSMELSFFSLNFCGLSHSIIRTDILKAMIYIFQFKVSHSMFRQNFTVYIHLSHFSFMSCYTNMYFTHGWYACSFQCTCNF